MSFSLFRKRYALIYLSFFCGCLFGMFTYAWYIHFLTVGFVELLRFFSGLICLGLIFSFIFYLRDVEEGIL